MHLVDAARAVAAFPSEACSRACWPATRPRRRRTPPIANVAVWRDRLRRRGDWRCIAASAASAIDQTGAFFGAGTSLLVACLCLVAFALRRPARRPLQGHGWWAVCRLGLRHAADRPGRSVLVVAVIAAATFILISVDAFRRAGSAADRPPLGRRRVCAARRAAACRWPTIPTAATGAKRWVSRGSRACAIEPFRVLPGDDASCLNLYEPTQPDDPGRAGPRSSTSGRFAFQSALPGERRRAREPVAAAQSRPSAGAGTVVPVIADANSMTYVLHKKLGDDIVIDRGGRPVRLRLVAALADSVLQSELVMSEANFLTLFPEQEGYQFLLVERRRGCGAASRAGDRGRARAISARTSSPPTERLAEYHRVENTYISTFQTLGGLGLLVGTIGLAAVLLRNVLERRRELALLGAVGYRRAHVFAIVLAENVLLLVWGLAIGTLCALVAVVPAVLDRGGGCRSAPADGLLLGSVFMAGLVSSMVATHAALRAPLLSALRAE